MYFTDLNDDQIEALFARVDWHRVWLQRLHDRVVRRGFPPTDAFRKRVRNALVVHRELALFLNDSRRKGRVVRRRCKEDGGMRAAASSGGRLSAGQPFSAMSRPAG